MLSHVGHSSHWVGYWTSCWWCTMNIHEMGGLVVKKGNN